ncbi:MAG: hypothetical protein LBE21_05425 [Pseudomonadales bacterium]|jgi:hypothetical protein|nr:hypothetical protein [Pseudomonadales bacterium]
MNAQTLLLRQVHPNFFVDGEVSSQAFYPFPKDSGKLSVYDGDGITPERSYWHYTRQLGLSSIGVWAVIGAEAESVKLTYLCDPLEGNPHHAVIDFGGGTDKEYRKLAKQLKRFAADRGCLYQALV